MEHITDKGIQSVLLDLFKNISDELKTRRPPINGAKRNAAVPIEISCHLNFDSISRSRSRSQAPFRHYWTSAVNGYFHTKKPQPLLLMFADVSNLGQYLTLDFWSLPHDIAIVARPLSNYNYFLKSI